MVDTLRVISLVLGREGETRADVDVEASRMYLEASTVIDGTVSEVEGQLEVNLRVFEAGSDTPVSARRFSRPRRALALSGATQRSPLPM